MAAENGVSSLEGAGPGPVSNREEDSMNLEPSQSGKQIIGIIYPPPEIRNIVDKTASFVARNGFDFEQRIKATETGNAKFNFLNPTDPYNAYYKHKVKEFQEGTAVEPTAPKPQQKLQEAVKAAEFIPKDPPAELEFTADPATINAFDLDLIRCTALFVARNGRQFLTALMNREARNYQFDFLKPQHSNFPYFTKLVEQYTKVLIPPKNISGQLRSEIEANKSLLEDVKYRVEWERLQRRQREKIEAEAEAERMAYAQIDWHDFVVVQTVDFQPNETANLPPPCTPKDVGARILLQQRQETVKQAQAVEMDVDSDEERDKEEPSSNMKQVKNSAPNVDIDDELRDASDVIQPAPMPPKPDNVMVRRDYDPKASKVEKAKAHTAEKWVISPLTGEKIPADKLAEHMRFNTVDQQYFDQRQRELQEKTSEEAVFAPGMDISSNIKAFAERRTDIFGVGARGAEQTIIGKKMGEEEMQADPKAIWDGHQASVESITKQAAKQISIEQQIQEIHRAQGLLPDKEKEKIGPHTVEPTPLVPRFPAPNPLGQLPPIRQTSTPIMSRPPLPRMPAMPPMPPRPVLPVPVPVNPRFMAPNMGMMGGPPAVPVPAPAPAPPAPADEPANKKARVEQDLVDEQEWIMKHGGAPVAIVVQVPSVDDKPEWTLNGQTITVNLTLTQPVSSIKQHIQDATNMPASKQKLVYEAMFIKDQQSLAFYNMGPGSIVQLQLKERGGRRK